MNSVGKMRGDIGRKIKNISQFSKIVKVLLWGRDMPKQCKTKVVKYV
jgi:hypothetical protein